MNNFIVPKPARFLLLVCMLGTCFYSTLGGTSANAQSSSSIPQTNILPAPDVDLTSIVQTAMVLGFSMAVFRSLTSK
jgi:TRAP-type C4-dicarboxylate transport system permease small subunit